MMNRIPNEPILSVRKPKIRRHHPQNLLTPEEVYQKLVPQSKRDPNADLESFGNFDQEYTSFKPEEEVPSSREKVYHQKFIPPQSKRDPNADLESFGNFDQDYTFKPDAHSNPPRKKNK